MITSRRWGLWYANIFSFRCSRLAPNRWPPSSHRLAAMHQAEKNIDDLVGDLNQTFRRLRQTSIDEELFDVISGYECLSKTKTR